MTIANARGSTRLVPIDPVFRSIAESSPDSIMLLDSSARIEFISRTAPGLTVEQVVGTRVYEWVPESQHAAMAGCFARVEATLEPDGYDNVFTASDGETSLWESRVAPVLRDGAIVGFVVIASDTTERRAAALDRDRFFRLSLDLLCVLGLDGLFKLANPSFGRVLGYDDDEILAMTLFELVHPEDLLSTRAAVDGLASGGMKRFENRVRGKDGEYRVLQWQAIVDPETRRIHAVARDVTDERVLQAQLAQSQKMEAIGQLAGGVAHDFNNLMLAVLANASFVKQALDRESELVEPLEQIESAGRRAAALTRQLLSVSRRRPLHKEAIELDRLVGHMMQMLRRLIPENIELAFTGGPQLPRVEGDAGRLEQVVLNLCLNARDAMPDGGRIELSLRGVELASPEDRWVMLEVADSGRGMPPEVQVRAFEPFFTTKGVGEGSGLGLATVYGIVEQHAGKVILESAPGVGTRVQVYLPASARAVIDDAARPSASPGAGAETILVVEDEALVRDAVVRMLKARGYTVLTAADGRAAVATFAERQREIDLVLLDVVMPELGGPAAYAAMAELSPGLPVLFTSGYADPRRLDGAIPPGTVVLGKPYGEHELLARVRACLDVARAGTQEGAGPA